MRISGQLKSYLSSEFAVRQFSVQQFLPLKD